MERFLLTLARLTPARLLLLLWALVAVITAVIYVPALEGVATAGGFILLCGYPYVLILGLPGGVVRSSVRTWARWLFIGFCIFLMALPLVLPAMTEGYSTPSSPGSAREWMEIVAALAVNIVVFAPFVLGSAALNDLRRAAHQDPPMESISNFLALYFGLFGGLLYVHRRVREALDVG
jgi:hypothetical protein